jgi:hypothetical protein
MKTLLFLLSCVTVYAADPLLPDTNLTPGDVVTNVPIQTLMQHGYTATKGIRSVSGKVHKAVFVRYNIADVPGHYEVDHLISLELGGSNSISNLWPQSYVTMPWNAHVKDKLENYLARRVREELRTNDVASAQRMLHHFQLEIAENWITCFKNHMPVEQMP